MGTNLNYQKLYEQMNAGYDHSGMPSHAVIADAMRKTAVWVRTAPDSERIHGRMRSEDGTQFCAMGKFVTIVGEPGVAHYLSQQQCDVNLITCSFDHHAYNQCATLLESMADYLERVAQPAPVVELTPEIEEAYLQTVEILVKQERTHATLTAVEWIDKAELTPLEDSWALEAAESPPQRELALA